LPLYDRPSAGNEGFSLTSTVKRHRLRYYRKRQ
jgi:hypothetical protein